MKENLILIDNWSDVGIYSRSSTGQSKIKCPACKDTRTDKSDTPLSVNWREGVAKCHYCDTVYKIKSNDKPNNYMAKKEEIVDYKKPDFSHLALSEEVITFFKTRGIKESTIEYFKITEANIWMRGKEVIHDGKKFKIPDGYTNCIAFNYYLNGEHVNTKFRASQKRFKLVQNAKLVFYNIDSLSSNALKDLDWCAIQEGEIDTLSAYQCGIYPSISVPNGASKGSQKAEYLDHCIDLLESKKKIIIATDDDAAGRSLATELTRRLGAERCYTIQYPEGCKDTNEVLLKYGERAVKEMYDNAQPLPIDGISTSEEVELAILDLYENGLPPTFKIGYPKFDELFSVRPGELTTGTGKPGDGKSTFLDQILVRLAARHDWQTLFFSPENHLNLHGQKLIQKFIGKPMFGEGKMSRKEFMDGVDFVKKYFYFMKYNEVSSDIDGILSKAREMVARRGINSLVIDPYNCIEHKIPKGYSETQYISELLSKITNCAKLNQLHIFLIAHPVKLEKNSAGVFEVPNLYKIAGSANFYNKTDNGFAVFKRDDVVEVHIQKIKFDFVGHTGLALFHYDPRTGRYAEVGMPFENEYDLYRKRIAEMANGEQGEIEFQAEEKTEPEPEPQTTREAGELTPFSKLIPNGYGDPPF